MMLTETLSNVCLFEKDFPLYSSESITIAELRKCENCVLNIEQDDNKLDEKYIGENLFIKNEFRRLIPEFDANIGECKLEPKLVSAKTVRFKGIS